MAQSSGPKTNQTFTDAEWRRGVGAEPSIQGDLDGSAYAIALANNSDVASIGSTTQESTAVVGGFPHWIPAGQPEGVTIPGATTAARTDLIVLRYDPTWGATDPGPVRLAVISGTEGAGLPTYDAAPPGVEDFPLWAVTRQPGVGQSLSQATTVDLRVRSGPNLLVKGGYAELPQSSPLSTRAFTTADGVAYVRLLDAQQNPVWRPSTPPTRADVVAGTTSQGGDIAVTYTTPLPTGMTYVMTGLVDLNIGAGIGPVGLKAHTVTNTGFVVRVKNASGAAVVGFPTAFSYEVTAK